MSGRLPLKAIFGSLLAFAALYCAYRSWDDARFAYLRGSNVTAAHDKRPLDAFALGKVIDGRMGKQQSANLTAQEERQVKQSLAEAPLSRALLRIVGVNAESAGNVARADTAIGLSNAISRRDALTQLWLIERSVSKDDMNEAVRHYHAALSVHPELGQALFPILAKASAFPEVRHALAPYLARQARWSADFLDTALKQGKPADIALLIIPVGDMVRGEAYEDTNARLIGLVADTGDFALAEKFAAAVVPGLKPGSLRTLAVSEATTDKRLGKLAWALADGGRILASANEMGGLDVDIDPLTSGAVTSRTIPVVGGRTYVFGQTIRGGNPASDPEASLTWQAFCVPSQPRTEVWQQMLPKVRQTQRYESTIHVPAGCKGLELVLKARGPEGSQAAHISFEAFDLKTALN